MTNDDLTGIFDDITPDMFALTTSAVHEETGEFTGVNAFNAFTDENIRTLHTAWASSAGRLNPIAVLVSPTIRRHFSVEQDENLGQFLDRLKREAVLMGAHWFFMAKKNVFAVWYDEDADDEGHPDTGSDEAMSRAMKKGSGKKVGLLWYSERREASEVHHRHGAIEIVRGKLGKMTEGDDKQTLGVFGLILDAVRR